MQNERITIGFLYIDPCGNKFKSLSEIEPFYDQGEDDIVTIGKQLNNFLRQAGFIRPNSYMFMEDLTEYEYDAIQDYLAELRKGETTEEEHENLY